MNAHIAAYLVTLGQSDAGAASATAAAAAMAPRYYVTAHALGEAALNGWWDRALDILDRA